MKKYLLAAILATTLMSTAYANEKNKVSWRVSENFKKAFTEAEDVNWTVRQNFIKASFMEDGIQKDAYYDFDGELISTSTNIGLDELPEATKRAVAKKYDGYEISEVVKMETNGATTFYLSLSNNNESVIVKAADNLLSVFKKTIK